ncbi:adenosine deaminase [Thermopolyspora sp. NPDC052614]|uniref:adenosine deaminase n=1 Tax=Thermopolyspora sp. NPDC052614 TaxID=3155682 RepID=UPI003447892C
MPPKAELHVHIEGTLEPELVVELAQRNGIALPVPDVEGLRARYRFSGLQSFLDILNENMAVLRTERDFYDLALAYLRRARDNGVRRAEIFFDLQSHLARGVPMEAVFDGLTAAIAVGEQSLGVSAALLLCIVRDRGPEEAEQVLRAAVRRHRERFIGIGLASAEVGHSPSLFRRVYDIAAAEGLRRTVHAGEEGPPAYIREALDLLGAERIDHGIRAVEDTALVARLRDERIPLTVCPLSNVRLGIVPSLRDHPLPTMLRENLMVTINSDNPAYVGGYADDNYRALHDELGLDATALTTLAANSFDAAFIDAATRDRYRSGLDASEGV